jgi:ABC-type multidrug transport system fused ATPase/permease subunit
MRCFSTTRKKKEGRKEGRGEEGNYSDAPLSPAAVACVALTALTLSPATRNPFSRIFNNILLGLGREADKLSSEDGMARVRAAAEMAQAHEFIISLPRGYETVVGAGSVRLSGGQRQRIAIARGLVCRPRLLVMDESSASLDAITEARIMDVICGCARSGSFGLLIIAHRLSTVARADEINVLEGGRITERGVHRELMQKAGGAYRRLVQVAAAQSTDDASS